MEVGVTTVVDGMGDPCVILSSSLLVDTVGIVQLLNVDMSEELAAALCKLVDTVAGDDMLVFA